MVQYSINFDAAAAADVAPADVARLIYAADQEGVPSAFIQWHQGARGRGVHSALLHSLSAYVLRMELTMSHWNDGSFTLERDNACRNVSCAKWSPESLYQIGATVFFPTDLTINTALEAESDANLLRSCEPTATHGS